MWMKGVQYTYEWTFTNDSSKWSDLSPNQALGSVAPLTGAQSVYNDMDNTPTFSTGDTGATILHHNFVPEFTL